MSVIKIPEFFIVDIPWDLVKEDDDYKDFIQWVNENIIGVVHILSRHNMLVARDEDMVMIKLRWGFP
jgi:hypothetical protein